MVALLSSVALVAFGLWIVLSGAALERLHLGVLERYGEVISGGVIAALGIVFAIWPLA